jgi:hypothetical protein
VPRRKNDSTASKRASVTPWAWNASRELAAQLVADGQLENTVIAARAGVTASSFERWKLQPEFAARVADHVAAFRKRITASGIATKEGRIAVLKARAAAIRGMLHARGTNPAMAMAFGSTVMQKGIQVKKLKSIGSGPFAREVEEYAVDTGTLSEERDILKQVAIEMGDWQTKSQIEVIEGPSLVDILRDRRLRRLHLEEQDRAEDEAEAARKAGAAPEAT